MAKNIRRMLAKVLVLCMILSALPLQALAAEGEGAPEPPAEVTVTVDTSAGSVSVSAKETTTESGSSSSVVTKTDGPVAVTPEGSNPSTTVEYEKTETHESTTSADGKVTETNRTEEFQEVVTQETTETDGKVIETTTTEGKETSKETITETEEVDPSEETFIAKDEDGKVVDGTLTGKVEAGENTTSATPDTSVPAEEEPEDEYADLTFVENAEDGSKTATKEDGTEITKKADGSTVIKATDGTITTIVKNEDGSITTTIDVKNEDGTYTSTTSTTTSTKTEQEVVNNRELITGELKADELKPTQGDDVVGIDQTTTTHPIVSELTEMEEEQRAAIVALVNQIFAGEEIDAEAEMKEAAEALVAAVRDKDAGALTLMDKWDELNEEDNSDKTIIDLARQYISSEKEDEKFEWPENISEKDKALVEALVKSKDRPAVYGLLYGKNEPLPEGVASAEVVDFADDPIQNVNITVRDKAEHENNNNTNPDDDVYNADLTFEIHLTQNILGTTVVVIKQGDQVIAREPLSKWNNDVTMTSNNSFNVNLEGLKLQEDIVNLNISLENVNELTTDKVFVATIEKSLKKDDNTIQDSTVIEHTPSNKKDVFASVEENAWTQNDQGQSTLTFTYGEGTDDEALITVIHDKSTGELTISSNKSIYMDEIVLHTPMGDIKYDVPMEEVEKDKYKHVLVAGTKYTVKDSINSSDDNIIGTIPAPNNTNQDKIQLQTAGDSTDKLSQLPNNQEVEVIINGLSYKGTPSGNGNTIAIHTGPDRDNTLRFGDKVIINYQKNGKTESITLVIGKHEENHTTGSGTVVYSIAADKLGISLNGKGEVVKDLAMGTTKSSMNMNMSFNFNVNEASVKTIQNTKTTRIWKSIFSKETPVEPPVVPPVVPPVTPPVRMARVGEPAPRPQVFRLNNQNEELEEIPEEPVPLAAPVVTGDNSFLWIAVVLLSLSCMVAVNIFDKKNQHEAF